MSRELLHQMRIPMRRPGLIREATHKPLYERLETLGDAYLKWQTGLYVFSKQPIVEREGLMSTFRDNLTCNHRLFMMAMERGLDGYVQQHKSRLNEPFKLWNPALVCVCQMDQQLQYNFFSYGRWSM